MRTKQAKTGTTYRARLAAQTQGYIADTVAPVSNQTFSIELAQQLLDSDDKFPVEFDKAWQWLG